LIEQPSVNAQQEFPEDRVPQTCFLEIADIGADRSFGAELINSANFSS
jgi:hypothetical protein